MFSLTRSADKAGVLSSPNSLARASIITLSLLASTACADDGVGKDEMGETEGGSECNELETVGLGSEVVNQGRAILIYPPLYPWKVGDEVNLMMNIIDLVGPEMDLEDAQIVLTLAEPQGNGVAICSPTLKTWNVSELGQSFQLTHDVGDQDPNSFFCVAVTSPNLDFTLNSTDMEYCPWEGAGIE